MNALRARLARPFALALTFLLALSVLTVHSTAPAVASGGGSGGSLLGGNSWYVSEMALNASGAVHELSAADRALIGSATAPATAAPGFKPKPRAGGVLGMALNSVAVLGTVAYSFMGGEESTPDLPAPESIPDWSEDATKVQSNAYHDIVAVNLATNGGVDVTVHKTSKFTSGSRQLSLMSRCASGASGYAGGGNIGAAFYPRTWNLYCFDGTGVVGVVAVDVPSGGTDSWGYFPRSPGGTDTDPSTPAPPGTSPRHIETNISCRSGSGESQQITSRGPDFTLDVEKGQQNIPEAPEARCPDGTWLESGSRDLVTEGTGTKVPVETYTAPPWVQQQVERFPDCYPVGPQQCSLKVQVNIGVGTDTWRNCGSFAGGEDHPCREWWSLDRDPTEPEVFRCRFGGYALGLRACRPFADSYNPRPRTNTSDPELTDPTGPGSEVIGDPLPPFEPIDPTPEDTPNLGNCVPKGLELLNPWWVFKGVACALSWAFVPQTALSVRLDSIIGTLTGKAPFSWFTGFSGLGLAIPGGTCPDWTITVGETERNVVCGHGFTNAIRTARPVLAAFMIALALWPLIRSTAYAAFPILKPQPGVLR